MLLQVVLYHLELLFISVLLLFKILIMGCLFVCFFFSYIDQFSRSLYVEYKKSGIDVQCQVYFYFHFTLGVLTGFSFILINLHTVLG